jgi:hypothetical protein
VPRPWEAALFKPPHTKVRLRNAKSVVDIFREVSPLYGLGGTVWGRDTKRAYEVAAKMGSGTAWILGSFGRRDKLRSVSEVRPARSFGHPSKQSSTLDQSSTRIGPLPMVSGRFGDE